MRGDDGKQERIYSIVTLEERVPQDHPLRPIRDMVDSILHQMSGDFEGLYSKVGRPSIAPERLLRALLLQIFYTVRSERQMMEQLDYNLLFRWFVGLAADDPVWNASTFSKNRDRLLKGEIAQRFFELVLEKARQKQLLSTEHFTVDGTLIEAWASQKSFRPKDGSSKNDPPSGGGGNPAVDFRGQKRKNDTHASTTDPDARLFRKGNNVGAVLCYQGHVLMENRNGLVVDSRLTIASGTAERDAAGDMVAALPGVGQVTLGADKAYDAESFVVRVRAMGATPHIAQNDTARSSAIDGRTTRHLGYATSQRIRKRVEEVFGWGKTIGGLRKLRHRGLGRVGWQFTFVNAAYNLTRIRNLMREAAAA